MKKKSFTIKKSFMKKRFVKCCMGFALALILSALLPDAALADTFGVKSTGIKYWIEATGEYSNWEGVSNVSQFTDADGNYCFAYDKSKSVVIVKTKNGKLQKKKLTLEKKYPLFGGVICDSEWNYYLVSGRENKSNDTEKNTVFVSKYDKNGKLIKTFGYCGNEYNEYLYGSDDDDSEWHTKVPFHAGNCALAVNGNYLFVHYAREMYSGHQSNAVLALNISTMARVNVDADEIYSSHSFAQRAIPYGDGFMLASEGDAFPRAFTISTITDLPVASHENNDIFHFWIEKNAESMYTVNNNFAHMGGLAIAAPGSVALVGTSAKSLNKKAASENEQLFIQIFNPTKLRDAEEAYVIPGKRSGLSGRNGSLKVTDYGIKWLTKYSENYKIYHSQVVAVGDKFVVLYDLGKSGGDYKGVYYFVLDKKGKVLKGATKYSASACLLNPCEDPVCCGSTVYWTGNKYGGDGTMYLYSLKIN